MGGGRPFNSGVYFCPDELGSDVPVGVKSAVVMGPEMGAEIIEIYFEGHLVFAFFSL